jgi:hypothetical protein
MVVRAFRYIGEWSRFSTNMSHLLPSSTSPALFVKQSTQVSSAPTSPPTVGVASSATTFGGFKGGFFNRPTKFAAPTLPSNTVAMDKTAQSTPATVAPLITTPPPPTTTTTTTTRASVMEATMKATDLWVVAGGGAIDVSLSVWFTSLAHEHQHDTYTAMVFRVLSSCLLSLPQHIYHNGLVFTVLIFTRCLSSWHVLSYHECHSNGTSSSWLRLSSTLVPNTISS